MAILYKNCTSPDAMSPVHARRLRESYCVVSVAVNQGNRAPQGCQPHVATANDGDCKAHLNDAEVYLQ